ncbi:Hypothetical predicted protein [Cloeon dipterum]|uniref:Uncharacterized protein n=1 Tax=Cloeon dipterum TaxID=197152 RepID=A0A8S1DXG8_9INSE|nr:Hypothetical predicted protein [Cloeon dipterum]
MYLLPRAGSAKDGGSTSVAPPTAQSTDSDRGSHSIETLKFDLAQDTLDSMKGSSILDQSKCIFLASKLISEWLRALSTRAKSNTISAARLPLKYLRFGWEASGAQVRRAVEKIRAKAGAHKTLGKAEEADDAEQVENFNQRFLVEAQGDQKPPLEECKKLLLLMGKPFVDIKLLSLLRLRIVNPEFMHKQAPCEAKAQCAALVE